MLLCRPTHVHVGLCNFEHLYNFYGNYNVTDTVARLPYGVRAEHDINLRCLSSLSSGQMQRRLSSAFLVILVFPDCYWDLRSKKPSQRWVLNCLYRLLSTFSPISYWLLRIGPIASSSSNTFLFLKFLMTASVPLQCAFRDIGKLYVPVNIVTFPLKSVEIDKICKGRSFFKI